MKSKTSFSIEPKLHGHIIKVYEGEHPGSGIIYTERWSGYKFHQYMKWSWYFEYRYALLRVNFPKNYISSNHFDELLTPKAKSEILKNKVSAAKGRVTKIKNAIKKMESNWNEIFPIEDDESYQKAKVKLREAEKDLNEITNEWQQTIE